MTPGHSFDLDAYMHRVGHTGPVAPDLETLRRLHVAHLGAIPFENLDVRLGRPVGLDLESLQDKLVRRRRGGYCFEQNTLFAAALRTIGFHVQTLEARVRPPGATSPLPRTHMLLRVEVEDGSWLADVGFGGDGPLQPVSFDGSESVQPAGRYVVATEPDDVRVLRHRPSSGSDGWRDLYAFAPRPALPIDFEVAHHFTSTHPRSPFVKTLTVQRTTPEARHVLRGRGYTRRDEAGETRRELGDREVVDLLAETFALEVPVGDVLAALGSD